MLLKNKTINNFTQIRNLRPVCNNSVPIKYADLCNSGMTLIGFKVCSMRWNPYLTLLMRTRSRALREKATAIILLNKHSSKKIAVKK